MRGLPCVWGLLGSLCLVSTAWSQATLPQCELQVQAQYQSLVKDQLLPNSTEAAWEPALLTMISQLRIGRNQYQLKKQQAELAEQSWLQTNEQLRQALQDNAALRAEVERLKAAPPAAN
jgi:hypothetical protein